MSQKSSTWISVPEGLASGDFGGTGYQGQYGDTSLIYRLSDEELQNWQNTGKLYNPWASGAMQTRGSMLNPYVVKTKSGQIQYGLRGVNPKDIAGVWMVDNGSKDFVEKPPEPPVVKKELVVRSTTKPIEQTTTDIQSSNSQTVQKAASRPYQPKPKPIIKTLTPQQTIGLAKVVNGKTYYTFPEISSEAIQKYLAQHYQPQQNNIQYQQPPVSQQKKEQQRQQQQSQQEQTQNTNEKSPIKIVTNGNTKPLNNEYAGDNAGIFYSYKKTPRVNMYEMPPELAEEIRQNVTEKELPYIHDKSIYYSDKQLPGQQYGDTLIHYYNKVTPESAKEYLQKYPQDSNQFITTSSGDVYSITKQFKSGEQSMLNAASNSNIEDIYIGKANVPAQRAGRAGEGGDYIPIDNNKVIIRPNERGIIDAGHHTLVKSPYSQINFWANDLKNQTVKSAGVDGVSWKEAMDTYYPKPSVGQEIKEGLKTIDNGFFSDVASLFKKKKKYGGKLNYLSYFK